MRAFTYGLLLQWKLDIRSKSLLITCYVIPLLFFAVMGGIFTSIMPDAKYTLIQSMTVFGVSMGTLIGVPPSIVEIYASDIKKMYKANGVPMHFNLLSMYLSSLIHLLIMSVIIYFSAPIIFDASLPSNPFRYFLFLILIIAVHLSIGCILGLLVKSQAKLTMISQFVFLPSIMLSGIMFPSEMLPKLLGVISKILPSTIGFRLMTSENIRLGWFIPLLAIFISSSMICYVILARKSES